MYTIETSQKGQNNASANMSHYLVLYYYIILKISNDLTLISRIVNFKKKGKSEFADSHLEFSLQHVIVHLRRLPGLSKFGAFK